MKDPVPPSDQPQGPDAVSGPTIHTDSGTHSGPIAWMAHNHVAANLLMIVFLLGGFLSLKHIRQEVFPTMELNTITVSVVYPGATPQEVEQGILQVIEAQVRGIDGIKRISSIAQESMGSVTAELSDFVDQQRVLQDVKNAVDRIRTFPEQAERAQVKLTVVRRVAMRVMVHGEQPARLLRENAERIQRELRALDGITLVEIDDPQPLEIAISIKQDQLNALGLTLEDIARDIRNTARSVPAGGISTQSGEILVRINERRMSGKDFALIPISTQSSNLSPSNLNNNTVSSTPGTTVLLKDIAQIHDGFEDNDQRTYFNDQSAIGLSIYSVGDESPVSVANLTREYIEQQTLENPGLNLTIFEDGSEIFKGRINLLIKNAAMGLVLILLILGFFLDARLAFWVMLGLPVSIMGSFIFFSFTGATINMVSLFAFIITLGIVVDDAIIVGEAIHEARLQGASRVQAGALGAKQMCMPVTFAVLTNLLAFLPLIFVPGIMGDIFGQIPMVVISVLAVSLIESLLILPAHLGHSKRFSSLWHALNIPQRWFSKHLDHFITHSFTRIIHNVLQYRYITLAIGMACLILCIGLLSARLIPFSFLPRIDRDTIVAYAQLPVGSPIEEAETVKQQLVDSAKNAARQLENEALFKGIYATIGEGGRGAHSITVTASLVDASQRQTSGMAFARTWREKTPRLAGIDYLNFSGQIGVGGGGAAIQIELAHPNTTLLQEFAKQVADQLALYEGITDINNGIELGKRQVDISLTPLAESLSVSTNIIAQQLRSAFYGVEALRQQRGDNEIKVMVRLSENERSQLSTLKNFLILTPQGQRVPLSELAHLSYTRAYTNIERIQGQRVLKVTADVDNTKANLNDILFDIEHSLLPKLLAKAPNLSANLGGEETARQEALQFLKQGMLVALIGIYLLLAVPFRSYTQPLAVMLSIPFGVVGALAGHFILGFEISIISLIGIIGLTGIVINDSLVLIVTMNRLGVDHNLNAHDAALQACIRRFRPILLTSLTTFFGLLPMLFETSVQARFLIPMAISIGFGVLFATAITLALVPAMFLAIEDIKRLFSFIFVSHTVNDISHDSK